MCNGQTPARRSNPGLESPPGSPPYAGFRSAQPEGLNISATGPELNGWPRAINWGEFRSINSRPQGESEDAQISVELRPGRVSVERENGQFKLGNVTFRMGIKRSESWVVQSKRNATLLAHEQGHYDIAGLFYRDMVVELNRLRTNSRGELAREVRRIMEKFDQQADSMSDLYDSEEETNHGLNADRQQAWESQISHCMQNDTQLTRP